MMIGGLIFLFALAYTIQLVLVISALAHEIDEDERKIFKNFNQFLVMLIPMTLYLVIVISGINVVKEHFKKDNKDE